MTGFFSTRGVMCMAVLAGLAAGCAEEDKKKWDDFFKPKSGSIFSRHDGESETWTIECNEYLGAKHRQIADSMADALRGMHDLKARNVTVDHQDDRSRVYYGEYELHYAKAGGDELQIELNNAIKHDLEFIRTLAVGDQHPFFQARATMKPTGDAGPPEWNLKNAHGRYTLHVGVTYATPTLHDYKEAAIEWVRDLRSRGHEAYYYHDPEKPQTSICVGTFGEEAMAREPDGRLAYSDAVKKLQSQEEFQFNLENGHKTFRLAADQNGQKQRMANYSFLVEIPQPGQPRTLRSRKPTTFLKDFE